MGHVTVWWDMNSCPLPPNVDPFIVRGMANALLKKFNISAAAGVDPVFSAYKFSSPGDENDVELEQTLVNSGIRLQLLQPGRSNEIEKMIMVDVLLWAMDVPPPGNIVFIVGDVDFSYVFHKLEERSYNVFLVCLFNAQMPHGMLSATNECLGWLTFLNSLEDEEKLHFSSSFQGWDPEHYQAFSNTHHSSSSTVSSKEWEEYQSRSSFGYVPDNSFAGQPSFNSGWDSSQFGILPLDEATTATVQQSEGPGFQRHGFARTEKPMGPGERKPRNRKPSAMTGQKKRADSIGEFKAWLRQAVSSKENVNGYNISTIRKDFEKATGKYLDFNFLGFPKISNLLEQCNDVIEMKEVKRGCHLAFPVKTKESNLLKTNKPKPNPNPMKGKPGNSPCGVNLNPNLNPNPKPKPKPAAEADQRSMPKASKEDLYVFLLYMRTTGEFSQGFLMSQLPKKFESVSGKVLDVQHLGHKKLSSIVEVYSDIVSVDNTGPGPQRIYPAGFIKDTIPISDAGTTRKEISSHATITSKEISVNADYDLPKQKEEVEMDRSSTGGSDRCWKENIANDHLSVFNSELNIIESECPSTSLNSWPSMSFIPTETRSFDFPVYNNSDSSSTPRGSQVSEWEGPFPNTVVELPSHGNSHQLEGSEYVNQFVQSMQKECNGPKGNATNAEFSLAEAMQNMRLNTENKNVKEAIMITEHASYENSSWSLTFGKGLSDVVSSQLESPFPESNVKCNTPSSPLQSLSEESVVCSKDLQYDSKLDCKQIEENACSAAKEETNVNTNVSPTESIMQAAGRGLKTICELTKWKRNH